MTARPDTAEDIRVRQHRAIVKAIADDMGISIEEADRIERSRFERALRKIFGRRP